MHVLLAYVEYLDPSNCRIWGFGGSLNILFEKIRGDTVRGTLESKKVGVSKPHPTDTFHDGRNVFYKLIVVFYGLKIVFSMPRVVISWLRAVFFVLRVVFSGLGVMFSRLRVMFSAIRAVFSMLRVAFLVTE